MYLCDHKQDKFIDMKIMIIDGGPRKTMNTAAMIEKFSEGVKSVDKAIEVKHVRLYDIDYKGCYSCLACKVRGKASHECKIKDGLLPIIQEVNQSDGLVLASPVFFGRWDRSDADFYRTFHLSMAVTRGFLGNPTAEDALGTDSYDERHAVRC